MTFSDLIQIMFYLIIDICLHIVMWFQVTNNNP